MNLKERARKLKTEIPAIFLSIKCPQTPAIAKIFAAVTVGYALPSIDLAPDFIPVLGYLDGVILMPCLAALSIHFIPEQFMKQCRADAVGMWRDGKPKEWYYAIPIVLF